jgi:4a-hydroxytetrahydrobiopterin dehydratase
MAKPVTGVYSEDNVRKKLAESLPQWTLEDGTIRRKFRTSGWPASLMAANAVGHLAEAAWHHPDILLSYGSVEIRLSSHDAGGITDQDFGLAEKIEAVVACPAKRAEGAPPYILPDS